MKYKIKNSVYSEPTTCARPIFRKEFKHEDITAVAVTIVDDIDQANGIACNDIDLLLEEEHPSMFVSHIGNLKPADVREILDTFLKQDYLDMDKYVEVYAKDLSEIPEDKPYYYEQAPSVHLGEKDYKDFFNEDKPNLGFFGFD